MIELIPSKDVREYIKETGRTFIDFEKAAIIFNLYLPFYQMQHELKTIAENTKDNVLKAQLVERIEMDIENIEAFKLNIEGFVYAVNSYEYGGDAVAKFSFDKEGTLRNFWSTEMSHSDEKKLDIIFNPRRFENAYVDIPNPFEAGDIVRLTTDGGQGIVMTSQKEWKEYNEKMKATNCADFSDVNIIVDLLLEDGHIVHNHINPIFLEKYDPTTDFTQGNTKSVENVFSDIRRDYDI